MSCQRPPFVFGASAPLCIPDSLCKPDGSDPSCGIVGAICKILNDDQCRIPGMSGSGNVCNEILTALFPAGCSCNNCDKVESSNNVCNDSYLNVVVWDDNGNECSELYLSTFDSCTCVASAPVALSELQIAASSELADTCNACKVASPALLLNLKLANITTLGKSTTPTGSGGCAGNCCSRVIPAHSFHYNYALWVSSAPLNWSNQLAFLADCDKVRNSCITTVQSSCHSKEAIACITNTTLLMALAYSNYTLNPDVPEIPFVLQFDKPFDFDPCSDNQDYVYKTIAQLAQSPEHTTGVHYKNKLQSQQGLVLF